MLTPRCMTRTEMAASASAKQHTGRQCNQPATVPGHDDTHHARAPLLPCARWRWRARQITFRPPRALTTGAAISPQKPSFALHGCAGDHVGLRGHPFDTHHLLTTHSLHFAPAPGPHARPTAPAYALGLIPVVPRVRRRPCSPHPPRAAQPRAETFADARTSPRGFISARGAD
jgi:hypothetical protein